MNMSKQTNDSFAGASMYFDAESNVSSGSTYNTMEAMSDASTVGGDDSRGLNSTLEANVALPLQQLKVHSQVVTAPSPLRAFSKNILQEHRMQCSTPSKEQVLQNIEVNRGSDDLHQAFDDMEKLDKLLPSTIITDLTDENKENMLPEKSSEDSTLSALSHNTVVGILDGNRSIDIKTEKKDEAKDISLKDAEQNSKKIEMPQKPRRSMLPARIVRKSLCPPRIVATQQNSMTQLKLPIPKVNFTSDNKPLAMTSAKPEKMAQKNKRQTMVPTAQADKRPFHYAQRMSVLVKTTLNSPARKIMRRSVMPTTTATTNAAAVKRQSLLPAAKPKMAAPTQANNIPLKSTGNALKADLKLGAFARPKMSANNNRLTLSGNALKADHKIGAVASKVNVNTKDLALSKHTGDIIKKQPTANLVFTCIECNAKFRIKSLLDAHKRSHEDGSFVFVRKTNSTSSSNSSCNTGNQCKYCDKKFALVRALHIHLLQNCTKIPPAEKRKLEYTEMAHVEKAQLPVFSHSSTSSTHAASNSSLAASKSQSSLSSTDSVNKHDATVVARDLVNALGGLEISPNEQKDILMAPPSSNKVKKNTAHMGVYRTPTKAVPCHICKLNFKSVLEYTHHSMAKHSQNSKLSHEQPDT